MTEEVGGPEQVRHVTAPADAALAACLESLLPPGVDVRGLIDIGAVYVDRVRCRLSTPMPAAREVPTDGAEPPFPALYDCEARATPGAHYLPVKKGAYLRVHCSPRRFPEAARANWRERIVAESADFVVLDKPGGVPVHASLDNCVETALECTARSLAEDAVTQALTLRALHRLDVPTHGLLVMGKTPRFTSHFNWLMRNRKVHKEYRALTWRSPALGKHVHYMENSRRSPKAISAHPREGWQDCVLEVHSVERKTSGMLSPAARVVMREQLALGLRGSDCESGDANGKQEGCERESDDLVAFEVYIELHTGRTHQIRAQMSALGCPLIGDEMYNGRTAAGADDLAGAQDTSEISVARENDRPEERGRKRHVNEIEGDGERRSDEVQNESAFVDCRGLEGVHEKARQEGLSEGRDEHADKWRARDMEIRGSLALQAFKLSFAALLPRPASRPATDSEVAQATPGEEDPGDKAGQPDARKCDGKGKKRGRKRDDDNGFGCEATFGEVQVFELPLPWWGKNAGGRKSGEG